MRKILLTMLVAAILAAPSYAVDDDSTPYNPYPEPQPQSQTPAPKAKAPAKKKKVTKKASDCRPAKKTSSNTKKTAAKKAPVKVSAPKPSSLQQAITLMEQGNYETAKRYLLHAINTNRNDPNVWYWYGKYHEYTGNYYQAQYFYSKAVKIDPAFEKLSRVVYYPEDPDKTPLWDPKRPARVYPVETSGKGITTMTPDAVDRVTYPKVPDDPSLPKVPVYNPPQPGATPLDGDAWAPSVYVPPAHQEVINQPVTVTPEVTAIIAEGSSVYQQVSEPVRDDTKILRVDKPLYQPPEPGQQASTQQVKKTAAKTQTQTKSGTKSSGKSVKKKAAPRKTVKKNTQTQTQSQTQPQTRRQVTEPEIQNVPENRPVQPQTQPERRAPRNVQPEQPEQPRQPETSPQQYLPPVGQFAPDPGTISDRPMPPVGQDN